MRTCGTLPTHVFSDRVHRMRSVCSETDQWDAFWTLECLELYKCQCCCSPRHSIPSQLNWMWLTYIESRFSEHLVFPLLKSRSVTVTGCCRCFPVISLFHPRSAFLSQAPNAAVLRLTPSARHRHRHLPCSSFNHTKFRIWKFPKMISPKGDVFIMQNPIKIDDLGVPPMT